MEVCQLNSNPEKLYQTARSQKRSRLWLVMTVSALSACAVVWFLTDAVCSVLLEASTEALRPVAWLLRSEIVSRATPKESFPAHSAMGVTPIRPKIPYPAPTPNTK